MKMTSLLLLIENVKNAAVAASSGGQAEHVRLLSTISSLQLAAEEPLETMYRIGHQVRLSAGWLP